ncbi:hypothetical protein [Streptomyces tendae]|uniref:hypothetical protein n=1 Tax=Streptomyces tendae TaxID=1932 RepID=UPI003EBCDE0D
MPIFFAGLLLGGVSGGVTYGMTADDQLAVITAVVATVLTWLGCAALIFIDD